VSLKDRGCPTKDRRWEIAEVAKDRRQQGVAQVMPRRGWLRRRPNLNSRQGRCRRMHWP
jgi:hypothetical protein